jgi:hypothetical protein
VIGSEDEDVFFDFDLPITDETIRGVRILLDLMRSFEDSRSEGVEDAKFNSYIQIRIRSYNNKRELWVSSHSS